MRGIDAGQLEKACALLGDTVLDPALWPQVMEQISTAVGATGAALLQSDVRTPDIPRTASADALLTHYFRNNWHVRDIRAARSVPLLLRGAPVVIDHDILTPDELPRNSFYNEALTPFGFQWFAVVGFRAGSALWGLSIQRTPKERPFEPKDKHVLAVLSQRMTEVASLSTAVGRIALSSATQILNAVRQPAVALDRFGYVLDCNPSAHAMFDDEIHVKGQKFFVTDAKARSELEKLIDRLRITPDTAALPCEPIVVRRDNKPPVVIQVMPVHGAARTPFLGARVLLTLTFAESKSGPKAALLTKAFGLTPAEANLASIIAEGINPERAAERLGIARETARNQLKAVFAKTSTHRQAELIALLSRL